MDKIEFDRLVNQSLDEIQPELAQTQVNIWEPFNSEVEAMEHLRSIVSRSGKRPYEYQIEDILKFPKSRFRILFNHEMGLGKTMLSILATRVFKKMPVAILCKASLQYQQFREWMDWTKLPAQIITDPKGVILPVKCYIISLDLASTFTEADWNRLGLQTIIIDECQHIKNLKSKRTRALRKLSKIVPNVIATSANAIENHFKEYFPILSILQPDTFRTEEAFLRTWMHVWNDIRSGKIRGDRVKNPKLWRATTKGFIIHRKKSDVMKDLPPVKKQNHFFNLEKEFADVYEAYVNEFTEYFENTSDKGFALFSNLLGYFAKMRHLTGRAKVGVVVDYVKDFLIATEGLELTEDGFEKKSEPEKIVLFYHHKDVQEGIKLLLDNEMEMAKESGELTADFKPCLHYGSHLSSEERADMIEEFRNDPARRVMIASMLSAGEGLNLQFCSNSMLIERHWNHQKEEQAVVGRFHRPGSTAQSINANYVIALGTIDEWISQLVARKELIVKEANEGEVQDFNEHQVLVELAEKIASMRDNKPWRSAF